jgi:hypothetical protein
LLELVACTLTLDPGHAHARSPGTDSQRQPGRGSRACLSAAKKALTPPALPYPCTLTMHMPSRQAPTCPGSQGAARLLERGEEGLDAAGAERQRRQREPRAEHQHDVLPAQRGRVPPQRAHLRQRQRVDRVRRAVCARARAPAQAPARLPEAAARQVVCSDRRVRGFRASFGIELRYVPA